ncbi:MAG: tRNA (guanosine(46)-N7)-methyltransferase TrmB [Bdellovibrionales bacterium]|nr:tRNA (guanosine(46)-N7)-methyltransferase TrmB [Bdellovibrionales bacterium]
MSRGAQKQIFKTRQLPNPNEYVQALLGEFSAWAYDEEKILEFKGKWRQEFQVLPETPLDLEIGTGNGFHFAWRAGQYPDRILIGLELKYKPLIQSIRRALRSDCKNARMGRYNAVLVKDLFVPGELNDIYIHHPDPWAKTSQNKHRLIQPEFLKNIFELQKSGSIVEFKTDSEDYFDWALPFFEKSPYHVIGWTRDLHHSEFAATNFVTQFESLFLRKGQPIYYAKLLKQ